MEFEVDNKLNLAKVWCSRADQKDEVKQRRQPLGKHQGTAYL